MWAEAGDIPRTPRLSDGLCMNYIPAGWRGSTRSVADAIDGRQTVYHCYQPQLHLGFEIRYLHNCIYTRLSPCPMMRQQPPCACGCPGRGGGGGGVHDGHHHPQLPPEQQQLQQQLHCCCCCCCCPPHHCRQLRHHWCRLCPAQVYFTITLLYIPCEVSQLLPVTTKA